MEKAVEAEKAVETEKLMETEKGVEKEKMGEKAVEKGKTGEKAEEKEKEKAGEKMKQVMLETEKVMGKEVKKEKKKMAGDTKKMKKVKAAKKNVEVENNFFGSYLDFVPHFLDLSASSNTLPENEVIKFSCDECLGTLNKENLFSRMDSLQRHSRRVHKIFPNDPGYPSTASTYYTPVDPSLIEVVLGTGEEETVPEEEKGNEKD
jgi:hypothetical protein